MRVGGSQVTTPENLLTREQALRLYAQGSAWFSGEAEKKSTLTEGQFADLAVLNADFLKCPAEEIRRIESVLTVCDGRIVHAAGEFAPHNPPLPPVSSNCSPVGKYGGYTNAAPAAHTHTPVFGADGRLREMCCGCVVQQTRLAQRGRARRGSVGSTNSLRRHTVALKAISHHQLREDTLASPTGPV